MKPRGVHGVRVLCLFSELSFKHPKRRRTVYFLAESHFYILGDIQTAFLFRKTDISFTFPPLRINYILFISICQYPFHVFIGELFRDAETKARFFHICETCRRRKHGGSMEQTRQAAGEKAVLAGLDAACFTKESVPIAKTSSPPILAICRICAKIPFSPINSRTKLTPTIPPESAIAFICPSVKLRL